MRKPLTLHEVSAALRHEDGRLFWLIESGKAHAGAEAGRIDKQGYVSLVFRGHDLLAHRVIWLLTRGEWPASMLDHRDGNRSNNQPGNLRLSTNSQNQANRAPLPGRFKGVARHRCGKFQATCARAYIGLFASEEEAARAYDRRAVEVYGEFARINFRSAA